MAKVARFTQDNQNPVGMIVQSMLTETQFQAINGAEWVLADGRSVAGSVYESITGNSSVPDARGIFLRGAGSQTISSVTYAGTLGNKQNDQMQGHYHSVANALNTAGGAGWPSGSGTSGWNVDKATTPITDGSNGTPRTGTETRPANLAVNIFIKIN